MSRTQSSDGDRTPIEDTEVCVIGAGPAGAILAYSLAERGHDVVVLEAGKRFEEKHRIDRLKRQHRSDHGVADTWEMGGDRDAYTTTGEHAWPVNKRRIKGVGGTTLRWGGVTPRLREKDFEMGSRYGVGRDWPISYADLQPYYARAEQEIGVAGDDNAPFQPPREVSYPMDPLPPSDTDQLFAQAGAELGIQVHSLPMAINSRAYSRTQDDGTDQHRYPAGSKYTAEVHVDKATAQGATLIDQAPVQRLEHGPDGEAITAAIYRTPVGDSHRQTADVFVVAAGTYETPRLLLLSESAQYPNGLANSSGTVGRYLLGHPPASVFGTLPDETTHQGEHGPQMSAGSYQFYENESAEQGSINIMFCNVAGPLPTQAALEGDRFGDELLQTVDDQYGTTVGMKLCTEMLPRADNRITLDSSKTDDAGNPVPSVQFEPGDFARRGQEKGIQVGTDLIKELGGTVRHAEGTMTTGHDQLPPRLKGGFHPLGGARMGTDPAESVVDETLQTHDLDNLYISGGSVFVTPGAANPALTIMALSLKAADHIHEALSFRTTRIDQ